MSTTELETNTPDEPADAQIDHSKALDYWSNISPDVNGMLGGYPQISKIDIQGSKYFIQKLRRASKLPLSEKWTRSVDCGAGIGRVTLNLLTSLCICTDIVEPIPKFTSHVTSSPKFAPLISSGKVGTVYTLPLESFTPNLQTYDLIWNQWCLGHLTDTQLVDYLQRCTTGLIPGQGSWVVVKENLSTDAEGKDIFDEIDNSVTRTDMKFRALFKEAGLRIVRTETQGGFPKGLGLYPVRMYGLQPVTEKEEK